MNKNKQNKYNKIKTKENSFKNIVDSPAHILDFFFSLSKEQLKTHFFQTELRKLIGTIFFCLLIW